MALMEETGIAERAFRPVFSAFRRGETENTDAALPYHDPIL
jgi:hypothetical protein